MKEVDDISKDGVLQKVKEGQNFLKGVRGVVVEC